MAVYAAPLLSADVRSTDDVGRTLQRPSGRKGLGGWRSYSQVAHAVSQHPDGPYTRKALVAPPEHHNPTLKVSPVDGSWNLYSIKAGSGPIVVSTSTDQGGSWTSTTPGTVVSNEQNPGPFLWKNGTMNMWYRAHAATSSPCSGESIGVQFCTSPTAKCSGGVNPIFSHTSEDPSVFARVPSLLSVLVCWCWCAGAGPNPAFEQYTVQCSAVSTSPCSTQLCSSWGVIVC